MPNCSAKPSKSNTEPTNKDLPSTADKDLRNLNKSSKRSKSHNLNAMALFSYDPFREFDRIFDNRAVTSRAAPRMRLDVHETEKTWEFEAELPGIQKQDVNVNIDKDILTITAEKKGEKEKRKGKTHVQERWFGKMERQFRLPDSVDKEKAEAKFEDGVLKLEFAKKEAELPKKITLM